MIQYLQLPVLFDAMRMQQELTALGEHLWKLHFQVKHYAGEWSAIPLRSINGQIDNQFISPVEDASLYQDTELLNSSPYFREVLQFFRCPLMAVRLLKLSPGTKVHEHKDADLCFEEGLARFHIPVRTNPQIEFILQGEQMHLKEGECWYMNFNLPHSLHNKSNTDRVHLVIDAGVNDWMRQLFASPANVNKKEIAAPERHSATDRAAIISHLRQMNTPVSNQLADEMEKQFS
ncbi:MAG: aspartyl/asparaginyl beta-hydroxylase domain-containing protein [Ferruginibacter sp.]